jgi:hypothetical protein
MCPASTSDEEPKSSIVVGAPSSPTPSLETEICPSQSFREHQELDWEAFESDPNTATDGTSSEGQAARNASAAFDFEGEYQHDGALCHSHMDRFQHTQGTSDTSMPKSHLRKDSAARRKKEKPKKKHRCERCGLYFLRLASLEHHMTLHIGSWPRVHRCPRPRCPGHVQGVGLCEKQHDKSIK